MSPSSNNKRIAKNTLLLYSRMFILMLTSLFTSRVVLDALGAEDYGLSNVVGGIIVLFSFLNQALQSATQRFLTFNIGRGDKNATHEVFCMSMNCFIILSIVAVILGETVGLWFVNTQLNIPEGRIVAANWVYQFTIVQFVVSLLRIPYNSAIMAYEKMDFFAYLSLFEVSTKLIVAYSLYITSFDKLIVYSLLYTIIPILLNLIFKVYCNKKFPTTKYRMMWNKELFLKIFSFSGWSLFGSMAVIGSSQGVNILLNRFCGVIVNAAVGVSTQVSSGLLGLISSFQMAFQPQLVKAYAANDEERLNSLIFHTSKLSFFMVLIIVIPLIFTLDGVLDIWLVEVPFYTSIFCRLYFISAAIETISTPLWMTVQATGIIKTYQMLMSIIIILNLPLSYITLKLGLPPYYVVAVNIVVCSLTSIVRCIYMKRKYSFPLVDFIKKVIVPIVKVTFCSISIPLIIYCLIDNLYNKIWIVGIISIITTSVTIYLIGLNESEKELIKEFTNKIYKRK